MKLKPYPNINLVGRNVDKLKINTPSSIMVIILWLMFALVLAEDSSFDDELTCKEKNRILILTP